MFFKVCRSLTVMLNVIVLSVIGLIVLAPQCMACYLVFLVHLCSSNRLDGLASMLKNIFLTSMMLQTNKLECLSQECLFRLAGWRGGGLAGGVAGEALKTASHSSGRRGRGSQGTSNLAYLTKLSAPTKKSFMRLTPGWVLISGLAHFWPRSFPWWFAVVRQLSGPGGS
jgi:hypothetical protein